MGDVWILQGCCDETALASQQQFGADQPRLATSTEVPAGAAVMNQLPT